MNGTKRWSVDVFINEDDGETYADDFTLFTSVLPGPGLPATGTLLCPIVGIALATVGLGVALVLLGRKRRSGNDRDTRVTPAIRARHGQGWAQPDQTKKRSQR